jgi:hypothetical protein
MFFSLPTAQKLQVFSASNAAIDTFSVETAIYRVSLQSRPSLQFSNSVGGDLQKVQFKRYGIKHL